VPVPSHLRQPLIFTDLFNSAHVSENLDHLRQTLPRFGHSVVATRRGQLWLFGGYSLSHGPLNDIRLFDSKNNSWMQVSYIYQALYHNFIFNPANSVHHIFENTN